VAKQDLGDVLGTIVTDVSKVTHLINSISQAERRAGAGCGSGQHRRFPDGQGDPAERAGAEESASAAEELSAQAESLKGIVNNLVRVVRGQAEEESDNARVHAAAYSQPPRPSLTTSAFGGSPAPKATPQRQSISVDEQFLNLDDQPMDDF
jgi:methyl-accepting chemotaxis protein